MIDKIRQIKHSRMKPEEKWFLDMVTDLEEVKSDKYPNSVSWKKNGKFLFEQDLNAMLLWISSDDIWSVFYKKYGYDYIDTQLLINNMVEEYLKWYDFTPIPLSKLKNI